VILFLLKVQQGNKKCTKRPKVPSQCHVNFSGKRVLEAMEDYNCQVFTAFVKMFVVLKCQRV
jgi:hypothetical protein